MDRRELLNDEQEAFRMAMDGRLSSLWTAIPGIVQKVDYDKRTCEVQPSIQGQIQKPDSSYEYVNLPVLVDVPIIMPSAGGFTLSLPIKPNDEVLVVFASRCIDSWWQSGNIGQPMELRMHDLSDGFALPGPRSVPKSTPLHAENVRLTSDDNETYIEITPSSEINVKCLKFKVEAAETADIISPIVTVTASTKADIISPLVTVTASTKAEIVSPIINLVGNLSSIPTGGGTPFIEANTSEIKFTKVVNSTQNINTSQNITATGTVTGSTNVVTSTISLNTHSHTGVQTGPSNTGGPV